MQHVQNLYVVSTTDRITKESIIETAMCIKVRGPIALLGSPRKGNIPLAKSLPKRWLPGCNDFFSWTRLVSSSGHNGQAPHKAAGGQFFNKGSGAANTWI